MVQMEFIMIIPASMDVVNDVDDRPVDTKLYYKTD